MESEPLPVRATWTAPHWSVRWLAHRASGPAPAGRPAWHETAFVGLGRFGCGGLCRPGAALAYASGQRRGRPPHRFRAGAVMDLFDLSGKTAVVTGGSRGIGLMIARGLLQAGARVYISSRKADACAAAERELTQYGKIVAIPADLSTEAECLRLAGEVGQREPALNVLVNNAGATWGAPLAEFPAAAWDKVVDLNLKAPFFLTRAFLPLLEAAGTHDDPARVI